MMPDMPPNSHRTAAVLVWLVAAFAGPMATAQPADIQFFGDVYLSTRTLEATCAEDGRCTTFDDVAELLRTANHNVVNLEGPTTEAFVPLTFKRYLLRMPLSVAPLLRRVGIDVATLANNHVLDFGYQGLIDTKLALADADVATTGAGRNREQAMQPVILGTSGKPICLVAFSRTLPASFWATTKRPGTAFASLRTVKTAVHSCAATGLYPIAAFHWGREKSSATVDYQRQLAHAAIDAGARLVIGHHPHMLQGLEVYKGRPIVYSLGNFAFGSVPASGGQEGLAARLSLGAEHDRLDLVPLVVRNDVVHFRPRPLADGESDPFASHVPKDAPCHWEKAKRHWTCLF